MALELLYLGKGFNNNPVISNINLAIDDGQFCIIVGQSGAGKTTLLKILAGLEMADHGQITLDGIGLNNRDGNIGMIFQEGTLFPWLTVARNVEIGLQIQRISKNKRKETVHKYLELVGLQNYSSYFPKQISGGMQQLASLAQVLAYDPKVLLMDEPLASLDAQTRNSMQEILISIWQKTKKTIIFVTHSVDEAIFLGQKVVILSGKPGMIKQEFTVDLPYLRERTESKFISLREKVLAEIRSNGDLEKNIYHTQLF